MNETDPAGTCTEFNASCWIDNEIHILEINASSTGEVAISRDKAIAFLVSNGVKTRTAKDWLKSFQLGTTVFITLATNIVGPIYRYYGGGTSQTGFFSGDTEYCTPAEAKAGYNLQESNTAAYVEQLGANVDFGQDLVLVGSIEGGGAGVTQYVAYNPNEFVYGEGVPTGTPPPPPPISIPIPVEID